MLVLFQEGIPDIFFHELARRGFQIARIPTHKAEALEACRKLPGAEAIFFRANFALGLSLLDALPNLKLAALVSTGADNVDTAALAERGIRLVTGEGANAQAVFDYVIHALCAGNFDFDKDSLGVVGAGRIGLRLLQFCKSLGVRTAYYDPLLADPGSLEETLQCDVVTFHVPLTHGGVEAGADRTSSLRRPLSVSGQHPTAGMLNAAYFAPVKKKLRIIQSCRGGIWDTGFYRSLKSHAYLEILAQDVYPDEPPQAADLSLARFSTPHIAGYSTQGRLGGVVKGIQALVPGFAAAEFMPQGRAWFLADEAERFAAAPAAFMQLRDSYFWRKEFQEYDAAERAEFARRFPRLSAELLNLLF